LIVQTGLKFLDGMARNSRRDWDLKRELATGYLRIGDVQGNVKAANLGNTQAALESYRKAQTLLDAVLAHDSSDRYARTELVTLEQRIGDVYVYTGEGQRALATLQQAQSMGEDLLAHNPSDERVAQRLAQVYVSKGDALWMASAWADSIAEHTKAVTLLLQFTTAHPADRVMRQTLAAAYSTIGIDETRLGRLTDGLTQYQRALAILVDLRRQDPANVSYQRALMSTYSHLGDVYGNPKWRSLGDPRAALEAYRQMLAVARRLYETDPANQQAVSDYAIALTRVAAALPDTEPAQRVELLRESQKLLLDIQRVNPDNTMNRWDLSHGYSLIGDALLAQRDTSGAIDAYEQSVALAEALLKIGVTSPIPDLVTVRERLAVEAAKEGDRGTALLHARRILELIDPNGPFAKDRAPNVQRGFAPRGSGVMGLVYAGFVRNRGATRDQKHEDRQLAVYWLERSLDSWRQLQSDPAFAPPQRREMQQVEAALADMNRQ
jgi:tetratricopeptide (TPR) repeat protein